VNEDEQAIRALVESWFTATSKGDVATVLSLMADDVIFMVPGQEPFGKELSIPAEQCTVISVTKCTNQFSSERPWPLTRLPRSGKSA
jgi:ketosteroid isomerase-like protein